MLGNFQGDPGVPPPIIIPAYVSMYPGEKDRANMWFARLLEGTTWISVIIHEILTILRPVMPKRAGTSGLKINKDDISTLK